MELQLSVFERHVHAEDPHGPHAHENVPKNHIHVNMFRWFGRAMEKIKGRDWMSD